MGRESATTATVGLTRLQRWLLDTVRAEPEGVHGEDFSRLHAARFRSSLQAALGGRKLKEVLLTIPHVRLERRAGSGLPTWHYRAENGTGESQVQTQTQTKAQVRLPRSSSRKKASKDKDSSEQLERHKQQGESAAAV
jgi:hypothetical protein